LLQALAVTELCVCDLATLLESTSSAVSHQLRLLRTAGLVRYRKDGKMVYYSLNDAHLRTLLLEGQRYMAEKNRQGKWKY
jgi:DNA-binding transcriptional ArsR family regulator